MGYGYTFMDPSVNPFLPSGSGGLSGGSAPIPGSPGPGNGDVSFFTLATDSDGNTIDLNKNPQQIESSDSVQTRNLLLAKHHERVQEDILHLENEEDPTRRRERVEHLNREIYQMEIEVEIDRNQAKDAQRSHQIEISLLGEQHRKQRNQQSRLALLNAWLRVLIHTRERRPR